MSGRSSWMPCAPQGVQELMMMMMIALFECFETSPACPSHKSTITMQLCMEYCWNVADRGYPNYWGRFCDTAPLCPPQIQRALTPNSERRVTADQFDNAALSVSIVRERTHEYTRRKQYRLSSDIILLKNRDYNVYRTVHRLDS